jgi:hypothetical protein
MMYALGIFDGSRAIARLLKLLHDKNGQGVSMMETYRLMKEKYGVARTAVDSSLEAALKLGLVEQHLSREFKVNNLTAKGEATAVKVKELEKIITSDSLLE